MLDWVWGVGGVGGGLLSSKDVLVRELCVLGEGLRKRDADLDEHARRLEGTVKDLKAEQDRQESRKCHPGYAPVARHYIHSNTPIANSR